MKVKKEKKGGFFSDKDYDLPELIVFICVGSIFLAYAFLMVLAGISLL